MIGWELTSNPCSSQMIGIGGFENVAGLIAAVSSLVLRAPSPFACFSRSHDHSKVNPGGKKLPKFTKPPATQATFALLN